VGVLAALCFIDSCLNITNHCVNLSFVGVFGLDANVLCLIFTLITLVPLVAYYHKARFFAFFSSINDVFFFGLSAKLYKPTKVDLVCVLILVNWSFFLLFSHRFGFTYLILVDEYIITAILLLSLLLVKTLDVFSEFKLLLGPLLLVNLELRGGFP
jgi:hypothetical protein